MNEKFSFLDNYCKFATRKVIHYGKFSLNNAG